MNQPANPDESTNHLNDAAVNEARTEVVSRGFSTSDKVGCMFLLAVLLVFVVFLATGLEGYKTGSISASFSSITSQLEQLNRQTKPASP